MNPMRGTSKAVVLLSGGLDSATTLYYAKSRGYDCTCLIFDYGQRHKREIESAKKVAASCGARYKIIKIALPWKGSALLDRRVAMPKNRKHPAKEIPATYVPARNTVFISFAVSCAESIGAGAIFIGANAVDFSGYPDCRPGYYKVYNELIACGTKAGARIKIHTPLIDMTKSGIVRLGKKLGVPYGLTWSCYTGGKNPCLTCDSCIIRERGFREARIRDPLEKK